jgi:hypothetical protein
MDNLTLAQMAWLRKHPKYSPIGGPRPEVRFHQVGTLHADGTSEPLGPPPPKISATSKYTFPYELRDRQTGTLDLMRALAEMLRSSQNPDCPQSGPRRSFPALESRERSVTVRHEP